MESLRRGSALTLAQNALRASLGPGSSGSFCSMAALAAADGRLEEVDLAGGGDHRAAPAQHRGDDEAGGLPGEGRAEQQQAVPQGGGDRLAPRGAAKHDPAGQLGRLVDDQVAQVAAGRPGRAVAPVAGQTNPRVLVATPDKEPDAGSGGA